MGTYVRRAMAGERLTAGLWYERQEQASVVSAGTIPFLRVRRGRCRAHLDLVLLGGDRTVEVSFQPAAPVRLVREHARRNGQDPNGWTGALASAMANEARRWFLWSDRRGAPGDLVRLLGGMTHPVLGAAYEAGATTVGEVPRWMSASLGEPTVAACSARLFGHGGSSRPVVRALATLLSRQSLAWWQLAVVVAAAPIIGADAVARSLLVQVEGPALAELPSHEDIRFTRAGLALLEADHARRLVEDALRLGGGDRQLVAVLRLLLGVERDLRWPPPRRLLDLETACLRAAAIDPSGPVPTTPAQPAPPGQPAPRPLQQAWTLPRAAPNAGGPRPRPDAELRPGALARSLRGVTLADGLELVVPRTPAELAAWGRLLGNCLADFGPAVATGRTTIVGVREHGALVGALEIRDRRIVQLLGSRNRPPPARLSGIVIRHVEPML